VVVQLPPVVAPRQPPMLPAQNLEQMLDADAPRAVALGFLEELDQPHVDPRIGSVERLEAVLDAESVAAVVAEREHRRARHPTRLRASSITSSTASNALPTRRQQ